MNFQGIGRPFTAAGLATAAVEMGLDPKSDMSRLWAIVSVESRGFGFGADRRPKILFERHVFARQTDHKFDAVAPDISNPDAGGYIGGDAEYDRLQKAIDLLKGDGLPPEAALRSASWGLGQVMGFNFASVGFTSATDLVEDMLDDENRHLMAMAAFVKAHKLGPKLKANEWTKVAEAYNGKGQKAYDTKLGHAFAKFEVGGHCDLTVRSAQAALLYLGFGKTMGGVDGVLGDNTRKAIQAWRASAGLPPGNLLDDAAFHTLMTAAGL